LKPLDAYVAYGYVSTKSVVELVHRRAFINAEGGKKPLSDNLTVEKALGEQNIICLNDLSHEIYTVGPHFDTARKFLCTFKLSSPVGHYEKEILKKNDDVESGGGFLGEDMEVFLNKIL
jgi:large subunit ribosomal protein L7e